MPRRPLGQDRVRVVRGELGAVDLGPRLLRATVRERAVVDGGEAEVVDQPRHGRLGRLVVAGDRDRRAVVRC
jgi:hypothetical protein